MIIFWRLRLCQTGNSLLRYDQYEAENAPKNVEKWNEKNLGKRENEIT